MTESGYDSHAAIILHRASGYTLGANGPVNAGYIDMSIPFSAGALYSTTEDLLRWEQGLFGGKVLSAASLKKMTTPFKHDYGYGLAVRTAHGYTVGSTPSWPTIPIASSPSSCWAISMEAHQMRLPGDSCRSFTEKKSSCRLNGRRLRSRRTF